MRNRLFAVLLAAFVSGCGSEEADILPAGSKAVLSEAKGSPLEVLVFDYPEGGGEATHRKLFVPAGTHVIVLDDSQGNSTRAEMRIVEVRISEGEHANQVGYLARYKLRAARLEVAAH
jgi:hypothetical protein